MPALEGLSKERYPDVHPDFAKAFAEYVNSLSRKGRYGIGPATLFGSAPLIHLVGHLQDNTPLGRATARRLEEMILTQEEIGAARNNHEILAATTAQHLRKWANPAASQPKNH